MKAMILLGCPEAPAQTPLAVYASYKLNQMGYETTIVSNPAAGKLLSFSCVFWFANLGHLSC